MMYVDPKLFAAIDATAKAGHMPASDWLFRFGFSTTASYIKGLCAHRE